MNGEQALGCFFFYRNQKEEDWWVRAVGARSELRSNPIPVGVPSTCSRSALLELFRRTHTRGFLLFCWDGSVAKPAFHIVNAREEDEMGEMYIIGPDGIIAGSHAAGKIG